MSNAETVSAFETTMAVETFEAFIAPQAVLVDEARWHLDADGLRMGAVDAANVAMTAVELAPEATEQYDASGGEIGLDLERLADYVNAAPYGDTVDLALDPETLMLTVERGPTDFEVALIDPEDIRAEPDRPDLDLTASFTTTGELVASAVKACDTVSDHLEITAGGGDGVVFYTKGYTDSVAIDCDGDDLLTADLPGEAVTSLFSTSYLLDFIKPMPTDAEVWFRSGHEYPVEFGYVLADGYIVVDNALAPRIQNS